MKKLAGLLFCVILVVLCTAALADGVKIDATNFPDKEFRSFLCTHFGLMAGDEITPEQIQNTQELSCNAKDIESLKGIELFTSLKHLFCSENPITELDLRNCPSLIVVKCDDCDLTSLKVKGLLSLSCRYNKFTELDLSACPSLEFLSVEDGKLRSLDVSGLSKLETLECSRNQLNGLKVSNCGSLQNLSCEKNVLTELDVSGLQNLKTLECSFNKLKTLTLSGCGRLASLTCDYNELTAIDTNSCTVLDEISVAVNRLTSASISDSPYLTKVNLFGNSLSSLDISNNARIKKGYRSGVVEVWEDGFNYDDLTLVIDKGTAILANVVAFNANGGSGSMKSLAVANDQAFTLPANGFTRSGYLFTGWNTASDGSGKACADGASVTLKDEDLTVFAQWEKEPDPGPLEQGGLKKLSKVKASAVSAKVIRIEWQKLSSKDRKKAKKIEIQVATDKAFTNIVKKKTLNSSKTSWTVSGLTKNRKYYIRIRTFTRKGNVTYVSPWVTKNAKTKRNN